MSLVKFEALKLHLMNNLAGYPNQNSNSNGPKMSQENHVNIRKSIGFQERFPNLPLLSDCVVPPHVSIF